MPFEQSGSTSKGIALMKQRLSGFETEEGRLKGLDFKPRKSDVLVVSPPKCGTTWMQQIVHQLRTGGDMEFREVTEVVPWIELAHDCHQDLEEEQRANPRCYKTHCWYDHCPKGGKYIVLYREPCAVAYSFYNFFQGWFFQPEEVELDEFVNEFFLARGKPSSRMQNASYFEHLVSWWKHRHDPNVMFLFYEEMKEEPEKTVRAVALFIGVNDEEKIQNAIRMSSFQFMKANSEKFREYLTPLYRNKACGIPEGVTAHKVVSGSTSEGEKNVSGQLKEAIEKSWQKVVTPVTGQETYEEFKISFRKEKPLVY